MDIHKALELEGKVSSILKKEIPELYITLSSRQDGSVVLILRQIENNQFYEH